MTDYSRQAFRSWLLSLPQDEPFCGGIRCPVEEHAFRTRGLNWMDFRQTLNKSVIELDTPLIRRIDQVAVAGWSLITPREVITILDELETK